MGKRWREEKEKERRRREDCEEGRGEKIWGGGGYLEEEADMEFGTNLTWTHFLGKVFTPEYSVNYDTFYPNLP